ncbi:MAG: hypothetical protein E7397_01560 [Ruminococcaceae bacterium]|nr:hypothetical protein [Oscillospiraceae bacterium]
MKLMFNEDWAHFFMSRYDHNIEITEESVREFMLQYKDTQVTDFAFNVTGTVASYPSKILPTFCDKYLAEEENGVPVNFKDTFAKKAYETYVEKGLDLYRIWIDLAREIGIRPWVSIRMNDIHGNGYEPHLVQSSYIPAHPEFWVTRHRYADEYYDKCLDFEMEEVRNRMLSVIEEILERFHPDGLELDFTRECRLFRFGREKQGMKVLNEMMASIKKLTEKYSGNTPMPINLLVNGTAQTNLDFGLDISHWAEQGWIDSVVLLSRWDTINTDYEIRLWKRLLGDKIELGCGQQILVKPYTGYQFVISNKKSAFGQACANLYNGADFVYLYNYMDIMTNDIAEGFHPTNVRHPENLKDILKNIGSYETASKQPRSHVLTFDDHMAQWKKVTSRLPITFSQNQREDIKISMGGIGKSEKAYLILGFDRQLQDEDFEIYANCDRLHLESHGGLDTNITTAEGHMFPITHPEHFDGYGIFEIQLFTEATLLYAEVLIEAI